MSDVETRVVRCFAAVFPDLDPLAVQTARRDTLADWDSLASVTLVRVIEEEFGIRIRLLDLDELNGFQDFLAYLSQRLAARAS